VNAFRLPCCDQAICETCEYKRQHAFCLAPTNALPGQSTLPSSCPVCEHTPVAAEDCKPNKSLRTTIKVFLRTEEKKREALRVKEAKEATPVTPSDVEPTPTDVLAPADAEPKEPTQETPAEVNTDTPAATEELDEAPPNPADAEQAIQAQQDIPQPSIEVSHP